MKALRIKGLAELVEAIHGLKQSIDSLRHIARELASQSEGYVHTGDEDEDPPPHGGPKKKGPKKKHPKKKGF